jgi:hypothetical protein
MSNEYVHLKTRVDFPYVVVSSRYIKKAEKPKTEFLKFENFE